MASLENEWPAAGLRSDVRAVASLRGLRADVRDLDAGHGLPQRRAAPAAPVRLPQVRDGMNSNALSRSVKFWSENLIGSGGVQS